MASTGINEEEVLVYSGLGFRRMWELKDQNSENQKIRETEKKRKREKEKKRKREKEKKRKKKKTKFPPLAVLNSISPSITQLGPPMRLP